eukprot:TCONS_00006221-protein
MHLIFVLLCLVASSQAFLFGKTPYPDWDELSVTFMKYSGLPKTEEDARKEGWTAIGDGCATGTFYKGRRYEGPGSKNINNLLYDLNGNVAGIQTKFEADFTVPGSFNKTHVKEGNKIVLTAYFTDPNTICSRNRTTTPGYIGDNLYLPMENGPVKIPLKESDLVSGDNKWVKGRCFYGMGQHYWYDVTKNMDCNDFGPWFLLYNGGNLNAFGFAGVGNIVNEYAEHPTFDTMQYFFREKPLCLKEYPHLSTQHIYLQRRPHFNFC